LTDHPTVCDCGVRLRAAVASRAGR